MRLQQVTFTGIDGRTDLGRLWELQQEFPFVEWGVLCSQNWQPKNRYFNPSYLGALRRGLNLSVHLCGAIARAAVKGDWSLFREWAKGDWDIFSRCQLNVSVNKNNPRVFYYEGDAEVFDEVILQQRSADNCDLFLQSKGSHISALLDASGGHGIDTPICVLDSPYKIGYAGGFNPSNVEEKLRFLFENIHQGSFWIDMESGVRTDDWFDLDKVQAVLTICKQVISCYETSERRCKL